MKILGLHINKETKINNMLSEFKTIKKKLSDYQKLRPEEKLFRHTQDDDGASIPFYPIPEDYLYSLALNSDIVRIALNTLSLGIFRRGLDVKLKDKAKDNKLEKQIVDNLIESANENDQSLIDILKQLQTDVDVLDKIFLIAIKKYYKIGRASCRERV